MNAPRAPHCPRNQDAVGLALHALEPEEEMDVLLHLPHCASCRAALRDAEHVLGGLGSAVEAVDPPRTLRDEIVSAAERTPQSAGVLRPRRSPEAVPPPEAPSRAPRPPAPQEPAADRRRRRSADREPTRPTGRRTWLSARARRMAAVSLALVGVLTVGGLAVRTAQLEQQRDAAVSQAQSVADLMAQLDEPGTSHAVLAAPDGSTVGAVLVTDGQRRLVTVGLPPNAVDRETYVLWGIRNQTPVPIGTFDVGTSDPGLETLGSPPEAGTFSGYAISIEPGRVAPATPTDVVAQGQVEI